MLRLFNDCVVIVHCHILYWPDLGSDLILAVGGALHMEPRDCLQLFLDMVTAVGPFNILYY